MPTGERRAPRPLPALRSARVYADFPDPQLPDWAGAYHGRNHDRLVAVKSAYDPDQFFDLPQAIRSTERQT